MIQQITDGSNTCFAQKCSSVTAVMNGNIPRKNIYTIFFCFTLRLNYRS